jgi:hypothetical protein
MKKTSLFSLCFIFFLASSGMAFDGKKHNGEFGFGLSYITYKEPDVDMEEKGWMFGLVGSYTYHNKVMLKLEGIGSLGTVDYSSPSGELNDITNYMLEGRTLVGYDFSLSKSFMITPYVGLGYRYLNDDSSGKITSRGALGYERESNYYYSPIGLMAWTKLGQGWGMQITAEYDYFWEGKQKSHLGDAIYGAPTVVNKQNDGYGLRGSVRFQKDYGRGGFAVEPFIRYWKIDDSEIEYFSIGRNQFWAYEPENNSTELGVLLSFIF